MAIIYHYCSPETFINIIQNKKLWLCATNNMNDYSECEWVRRVAVDIVKKPIQGNRREIYKDLINYFNTRLLHSYAICFSKNGDILSQWRAYAQDGYGVAIGFDEDKFSLKSDNINWSDSTIDYIKIKDVVYMLENELKETITDHINGICNGNFSDDRKTVKCFNEIMNLSMTIKKSAFKEEDEKRIIYNPLIPGGNGFICEKSPERPPSGIEISEIKNRISNGYLTSYTELDVSKLCAIEEIILGPKNKFSEFDIRFFLKKNNLEHVKVKTSEATYR